MATKCKPQGPRCNKFDIWTKEAKLAKPQGSKWQFTHKQLLQFSWFFIFCKNANITVPYTFTNITICLLQTCKLSK
ncbi:hypothetical protein Hanom_Chr09g00780501 [Helianthus anomalus]